MDKDGLLVAAVSTVSFFGGVVGLGASSAEVSPSDSDSDSDEVPGKVEYRAEKAGIVHASIGKTSFDTDKLVENFRALQDVLAKAKPSSAKGTYFKSVGITTTMGPGVKVDTSGFKL